MSAWPPDLLDRFPDQHVVILGDLMLDEYIDGVSSRISTEAPVPVVRVDRSRTVLGGASNTAANVAALGGRAIVIGLCGDDQAGTEVKHLAAAQGIDLRPIADGRPTTRKTRVIGQHQQLLRLDHEVTASVSAEVEDRILDQFREVLPQARIIVLSDYAKGGLTERICQTVIMQSRDRGVEVIIDPRPEHGAFYRGCDFLTPNWNEALHLLGQPDVSPTAESIQRTGRALADRVHANIVLTLGPLGIGFFGRTGEHFSVPTVAREVFDVSGAGDTVVAALALARSAGADYAQAVAVANAAAGVVVGKLGTATVTRAELLGELAPEVRLLSRAELHREADRLKAERKRIVTINGSFDVLHYGHVYILQEARMQGDVLIVGLNSDSSVQANKGASRPIVPQAERARMLLSLRCVDYVHIFDEAVPMPFLEAVRPDVHVNGSEYGEDCIEAGTVTRLGGVIHVVPRLAGLSTSDIVSRIAATQGADATKR